MNIFKKFWCRLYHGTLKLAANFINFPSPELLEGEGSLKELANRISQDNLQKILIITDHNLIEIGLLDDLFSALDEKEIEYTIFDQVQPNPPIQNIEDARELYLVEKCDGIIAFGGGSPMDCAKIAGARITNPSRSVLKMEGMFKIRKPLPPLYAIPTTAGTGSETTAAAVVSDPESHRKFAIVSMKIVPIVAVLDPILLKGLPPHITASTGMDALTHAVEAYIGKNGTKFTDERAIMATQLIFANLEASYENGDNLTARNNMALAAFYAGEAFTRTSVGYVHAIAHNLGGLYGVPHGLANAIVLPYILEEFGSSCEEKLAQLAIKGGLGEENEAITHLAQKFRDKVRSLNKNMQIPTTIKELKQVDIPLLAKRIEKEGNPDYPVPKLLDRQDFERILLMLTTQK